MFNYTIGVLGQIPKTYISQKQQVYKKGGAVETEEKEIRQPTKFSVTKYSTFKKAPISYKKMLPKEEEGTEVRQAKLPIATQRRIDIRAGRTPTQPTAPEEYTAEELPEITPSEEYIPTEEEQPIIPSEEELPIPAPEETLPSQEIPTEMPKEEKKPTIEKKEAIDYLKDITSPYFRLVNYLKNKYDIPRWLTYSLTIFLSYKIIKGFIK